MFNAAERIAGLGTWEWTPDDGGLLWSDNLFRLFGLEPREIAPRSDYVLRRMHPDDRAPAEEALRMLLADELEDCTLEYRIFRAEGVIRTHRLTVATVTTDPRRIVGWVQDVTLARRLDHQLAARVAVTQALGAAPARRSRTAACASPTSTFAGWPPASATACG